MNWSRCIPRLFVCLAAVVFASTPLGASAEGDLHMADALQDPTVGLAVICTAEALPVRAAELSPMRLTCLISGAPATDTSFTLSSTDIEHADVTAQPVCGGSLADGAGTCTGIARDGASIMQGRLALTARLDPSGTVFSVPPPASAPPMLVTQL